MKHQRGLDYKYPCELQAFKLIPQASTDQHTYCRISRTLPLAGSHNRTIYLRTIWGLYFYDSFIDIIFYLYLQLVTMTQQQRKLVFSSVPQ